MLEELLTPEGFPGAVGGVVSTGPEPGARSSRTSSKLIVKVLAVASPISIRPIGMVPVLAGQAFTIFTPSR